MPRTVTVTLADGSTHTYQNAPDDITPEAVSARAQQEFGQPVTALDGGNPPNAPAAPPVAAPVEPTAAPVQDPAPAVTPPSTGTTGFTTPQNDNMDPARRAQMNIEANALFKASGQRPDFEKLATKYGTQPPGAELDNALRVRDSQMPPPVPPQTLDQKIQAGADQLSDASPAEPIGKALLGGLRSFPGVDQATAAAYRYLPSSITGNTSNASYDNILQFLRDRDNTDKSKSLIGNIVGQGIAGLGLGMAGGSALKLAGNTLATGEAATDAGGIRNALQELATMRNGETTANTAKGLLGAGTVGAAQSASDGTDPLQGAANAMEGGILLHGAGRAVAPVISKVGRAITRPYSSNLEKAIQETITQDPAALASKIQDLTNTTGSQAPVVGALNDQDYSNLTKNVLGNQPSATEIAQNSTGQYVRKFMDRMLSHVNQAGTDAGALQANGVGDLTSLQKKTADDLMAPVADKPVDMTQIPLDDVQRQVTRNMAGSITDLGPRVKAALRPIAPDDLTGDVSPTDFANAKKIAQQYGIGQPIHATVRELDGLRQSLDTAGNAMKNSGSNPVEGNAMVNAGKAIGAHLASEFPEYGQMLETFGKHGDMIKGFDTASKGLNASTVPNTQLQGNITSPEGQVGMRAGELFKLRQAAAASPASAINLAKNLGAEGDLTRPASLDPQAAPPGSVTSNLGETPAADLANKSQAESTILNRMVDTDKMNAATPTAQNSLSAADLAHAALLHGASPIAQARTFSTMLKRVIGKGYSQSVSDNLAGMLYSSDPAQVQKAMNALNYVGKGNAGVQDLLKQLPAVGAGVGHAAGAQLPNPLSTTPPPQPTPAEQARIGIPDSPIGTKPLPGVHAAAPQIGIPDSPIIDPSATAPEASSKPSSEGPLSETLKVDPNRPFGRQVIEAMFPGAHIGEDVRDPNSELGKKNPHSWHIKSQNAVDVNPIAGMDFDHFLSKIQSQGFKIIEARDEAKHPIPGLTTGKHWHVVIK